MFDLLLSVVILYILFTVSLVMAVHFFLISRENKTKIANARNGLIYAIPVTRNTVLKVSGREFLTFAALLKCAREKLRNPLCTDDEAWLHYVTFVISNYFRYLIYESFGEDRKGGDRLLKKMIMVRHSITFPQSRQK